MKKSFLLWMGVVLMLAVGMSSCNSDDDEIIGTGLTGKWDLMEVQNGPAGLCKDGYAIEGNWLKLHYCGIYFCDHIPATFVFKRTK